MIWIDIHGTKTLSANNLPCTNPVWSKLRGVHTNTMEPVLKDHPMGHIIVVSPDTWSLVTGSITLKYGIFCQEYLVFQDRWSFMAVVSKDRLYCSLKIKGGKLDGPLYMCNQSASSTAFPVKWRTVSLWPTSSLPQWIRYYSRKQNYSNEVSTI